jgi:hypothetical protein
MNGRGNSVVIGAIIIGSAAQPAMAGAGDIGQQNAIVEDPLGFVEVMGRSVMERMVDRFLAADIEMVSVLADPQVVLPSFCQSSDKVIAHVVADMRSALSRTLEDYSEQGIGLTFVVHANVYAECDLIDWIWFHRGTRQGITRSCDSNGGLDFWVVDCAKRQSIDISLLLEDKERFDGSRYFISEYASQIATPSDLRRLVTDVFREGCKMRPAGREIRPGVWIEAGAQIHRRARIVAPAYIGRGTRVREDTLITRCSNVESSCYVDYGTVVDDSSILTNSYVGIWLDVSNVVVKGNRLANVRRNVTLEISDPSVMRENMALAQKPRRPSTMRASARIRFSAHRDDQQAAG